MLKLTGKGNAYENKRNVLFTKLKKSVPISNAVETEGC
jgi:hypothetical protein